MPFRVLYNKFVKISRVLAKAFVKLFSVLIYISSFIFVFGNYIKAVLHKSHLFWSIIGLTPVHK